MNSIKLQGWIARDMTGILNLFVHTKPKMNRGLWLCPGRDDIVWLKGENKELDWITSETEPVEVKISCEILSNEKQ